MSDTPDIVAKVADNARRYRKSLRNANINYCSGWFFMTVQVRHNKSIFSAMLGGLHRELDGDILHRSRRL